MKGIVYRTVRDAVWSPRALWISQGALLALAVYDGVSFVSSGDADALRSAILEGTALLLTRVAEVIRG